MSSSPRSSSSKFDLNGKNVAPGPGHFFLLCLCSDAKRVCTARPSFCDDSYKHAGFCRPDDTHDDTSGHSVIREALLYKTVSTLL